MLCDSTTCFVCPSAGWLVGPLFWAAAPKGTKSFRTQGDFSLSVCPFVCPSVCQSPHALSGLKIALSGLKSTFSGLKSALSGLESGQILGLGGTDGWKDGENDEQKSPCVLKDFIPFAAAALLPLTPFHNHAKRGNGYR